MSHAGGYLKSAVSIFNSLEESKPHSSITDWVEVLSSDRYEEMSLDGIPELVESINIQGSRGTQEAARAIRKKLKYGNVHRQLRALVILRALTENAGKGFQLNWADQQILGRLKDMAQDVSGVERISSTKSTWQTAADISRPELDRPESKEEVDSRLPRVVYPVQGVSEPLGTRNGLLELNDARTSRA